MRRPFAALLFALWILLFAILACSREPRADNGSPFVAVGGDDAPAAGATPNAGSLEVAPFPTVPVRGTPTPDPTRIFALNPESDYRIQPGDSLSAIADRAGVTVAALLAANPEITDATTLTPGTLLHLPAPAAYSPDFKIIPNSELVYSPTTIGFDPAAFIQAQGGYLATYTEEVEGQLRTGGEIVQLTATRYSVNPRLLIALLEYVSGWVTNPYVAESTLVFPMGHASENWKTGLFHQLNWAANQVNAGYYLWRANGLTTMTLADGSRVAVVPTLNAGTVGVQYFFAQHYPAAAWYTAVGPGEAGFAATYRRLFGEPFAYTFDPLLPPGLTQPNIGWPMDAAEGWYYTGGPHGGWDTGSGWAALDFAPPDSQGCGTSPYWVRAAAAGLIVRSGDGAVVQDLSGDGLEQTGWALFYMHLASQDRAVLGMFARPGDPLGHPSCEGGFANARHLHFARKYNGEWIPADGPLPFVVDGWVSTGLGSEYDGYLVKDDKKLEACDCADAINLILFPPSAGVH